MILPSSITQEIIPLLDEGFWEEGERPDTSELIFALAPDRQTLLVFKGTDRQIVLTDDTDRTLLGVYPDVTRRQNNVFHLEFKPEVVEGMPKNENGETADLQETQTYLTGLLEHKNLPVCVDIHFVSPTQEEKDACSEAQSKFGQIFLKRGLVLKKGSSPDLFRLMQLIAQAREEGFEVSSTMSEGQVKLIKAPDALIRQTSFVWIPCWNRYNGAMVILVNPEHEDTRNLMEIEDTYELARIVNQKLPNINFEWS